LDITNKKSAIFRDIIIESEYDPLEPNRRAIKARTGKLKDPTLHILQKTVDEMVMLDPDYGKSGENRGGKYTLPTEMWASGKIEATPHGRFGKMMASANNEEKRKRAPFYILVRYMIYFCKLKHTVYITCIYYIRKEFHT
jgi:hypothetical protein